MDDFYGKLRPDATPHERLLSEEAGRRKQERKKGKKKGGRIIAPMPCPSYTRHLLLSMPTIMGKEKKMEKERKRRREKKKGEKGEGVRPFNQRSLCARSDVP